MSAALLNKNDDKNNSSIVKALKVRIGSPLNVPMIQFGWSKTEGRHVYLGEKSKEDSEIRKTSELKDVATEIFKNRVYISNQNLIKAIMESMDVKDRTARSYIKFMRDSKIIEKNPSNALEYCLVSSLF